MWTKVMFQWLYLELDRISIGFIMLLTIYNPIHTCISFLTWINNMHDSTCFYSIFQEESSTHDIISNISLNKDVVSAVDVDHPVETAVNAASLDVGSWHVPIEMEVDGVSTQPESLAHVVELDVFNSSNHKMLINSRSVHDNLGSKLIRPYFFPKPSLETSLGSKFTWNKNTDAYRSWGQLLIYIWHFRNSLSILMWHNGDAESES